LPIVKTVRWRSESTRADIKQCEARAQSAIANRQSEIN
jgi:hypothetical protein